MILCPHAHYNNAHVTVQAHIIATVQAHNSSNWQQGWQEAQIFRHMSAFFFSFFLLLLQLHLQLQTKTVQISKSFEVPVQNSKFDV